MDIGDVGQERVLTYYQSHGYSLIRTNDDCRWDLELADPGGVPLNLEVKTDTTNSPNLAIEIWSRNKRSGINVTQADVFCTFFAQTGELFLLPVPELREYVFEYARLSLKEVKALQGTGTWIKLLPKTAATRIRGCQVLKLEPAPEVRGISVLHSMQA